MGFYLRKSLSVGPIRFNLSGSGIGVSAGIKGFRVGTGPRGNYVHVGRHGLYYRATLPGGRASAPSVPSTAGRPSALPQAADRLAEIESGAVEAMVDSSSDELLAEIRTKRQLIRRWPVALIVGGLCLLLLAGVVPAWVSFLALAVFVLGTKWLARRDVLRKTSVLLYNLDPVAETAYQAFHNGFDWLVGAKRAWHLEAQGATADWKRNAGATSLARRRPILLGKADPPDVKTNIAVPVIPVGRQTLYFFPDRVLVFDGRVVGAVGYKELSVVVTGKRFIEEETVPEDAEVVGSTWRYVNKKGGPDRRFNNNRQLPIVLYGEAHFTSATGLNEVIQVSNVKAAEQFASGLGSLATALALQAEVPEGPASLDPQRPPAQVGRGVEALQSEPAIPEIYRCSSCGQTFSWDELVEVHTCLECEQTFSGTLNRQNCPECESSSTRRLTDRGCPACLEEAPAV